MPLPGAAAGNIFLEEEVLTRREPTFIAMLGTGILNNYKSYVALGTPTKVNPLGNYEGSTRECQRFKCERSKLYPKEKGTL